MAKVYAIHEITLNPGANAQDFEQFVTELFAAMRLSGVTAHLLKGDRGKRKGQYALLTEFDSVEVRNRYYPTEGSQGEGMEAPTQDVIDKWTSFSPTVLGDPELYTDYIAVEQ
jgi:hypothetical protein